MKKAFLACLVATTFGTGAIAQSVPLNTTTRGQGSDEILIGQQENALAAGGLTAGIAVGVGVIALIAIAAGSDDSTASTTTTSPSP